MGYAEPPTRVGELREASVEAVKSALHGSLLNLDPSVEPALAALITNGNRVLSQGHDPSVRMEAAPVSPSEALANLGSLVQEMANRAAISNTDLIDLEIYEAGLRSLCPIPPWC